MTSVNGRDGFNLGISPLTVDTWYTLGRANRQLCWYFPARWGTAGKRTAASAGVIIFYHLNSGVVRTSLNPRCTTMG